MPYKPIDYSSALIYKLVCKDPEISDCYVGSTTNFKQRKREHKSRCSHYNYYVYQFIRENGGWNNWQMILVEKYPCNDKYELEKREREIIELLKPTLNKNVPTRQHKERYEANHEHYLQYNKEYYKANRETTLNRQKNQKKQRVTCKFCGTETSRGNLRNHQKTKKCIAYQNSS